MIIVFLLLIILYASILLYRSVFSSVLLASIVSLFSVFIYIRFLAPDVAITEAAVGSSLSTIFFVCALRYIYPGALFTAKDEISFSILSQNHKLLPALFCSVLLFLLVIIPLLQINDIGMGGVIRNQEVARYYIENNYQETHTKNIVTGILASYRGFDTMLETMVIFVSSVVIMSIATPASR